MSKQTTTITASLPLELLKRIKSKAIKQSYETGQAVAWTSLMRAALAIAFPASTPGTPAEIKPALPTPEM